MIDIKQRLLELAAVDGCETSKYAAHYIGKLEARIEKDEQYKKQLRIKLDRVRRKRDDLLAALGHDPETDIALSAMREHRDI